MNVGEPITTEDVEKVINKIDQDGSGDISKRELHAVLAKAGFHASERVTSRAGTRAATQ